MQADSILVNACTGLIWAINRVKVGWIIKLVEAAEALY